MINDEIMAKLSKEDREALALEIGQEVEKALARQEMARQEAADPVNIRRDNLGRMYAATPQKTTPEISNRDRQLEASTAWQRGERWPSTSKYPSMDYEAMDKAREAAKAGEDK